MSYVAVPVCPCYAKPLQCGLSSCSCGILQFCSGSRLNVAYHHINSIGKVLQDPSIVATNDSPQARVLWTSGWFVVL